MRLAVLALIVAVLLLAPAGRGADPVSEPRKLNPVTYEVDFSAVVTPPYHCQVLRVWLPLPQSDGGQAVGRGELSSFPMAVEPRIGKEPKYGNQFAYFEFSKPEGAQIIRHKFKIKVWEVHWDVDPAKVAQPKQWPASLDAYLKSDQTVVVNDQVRKLARDIVPKPQGPVQDVTAVMDWVNQNIQYDHVVASLQANSEHALKTGRGHCSDYHGLCASFGRALGSPARVAYGINPFPKNSPSHCKLEVYLPPYGWVSFDVSETQQLIEVIQKDGTLDAKQKDQLVAAAKARLARGFRDNTWFAQTRGTDYDLAPPAARRVPVVRTLYAEADGVALPDPDPANKEKKEFAWMTVHQYKPDKQVFYPFKDWKTLLEK